MNLPDFRHLYSAVTDFRTEVAVILAGDAGPLRALLTANPALAARFPTAINFPVYTPAASTCGGSSASGP